MLLSILFFINIWAQAAEPLELSGLASLDSCSGAIFNPGLPETEKALVLTAGHCVARSARLPVKGAVRNVPYGRSGVRVHFPAGALYLTAVKIRFATMDGIDLALLELPLTFREIAARGSAIFEAETQPSEYVNLRSAHWAESSTCRSRPLSKALREGAYRFDSVLAIDPSCGKITAGYSGSPALSESGKVIGVVFTTSSGEGAPCAEGNPCEAGGKSFPGQIYAQLFGPWKECLASRFEAPACRKRWAPAAWSETPPKFSDEVVEIPADALTRKAEFLADLAGVTETYREIAIRHGKTLTVDPNWNDTNVLGTEQVGSRDWSVRISGALARHPAITRDALLLATCHEFGHQLAGYPFKRDNFEPGDRIHSESAEAQADYFASLACARRIWKGRPENAAFRGQAGFLELTLCEKAFALPADQDLCLRNLAAAGSLSRFFSAIHQVNTHISTPDSKETRYSIIDEGDYPSAQCRVDTLVAGALCPRQWDDNVIPALAHSKGQESFEAERAAADYSCFARDGFSFGVRPRCWYVPK